MPESLNVLDEGVFTSCTKLSKIDIPNTVIYIGQNAFSGTNWLKAQSDETFIVAGDGILVQYNGNAAHIVIPDTVKRIPDYRFESLSTEPESFTIPASECYDKNSFSPITRIPFFLKSSDVIPSPSVSVFEKAPS